MFRSLTCFFFFFNYLLISDSLVQVYTHPFVHSPHSFICSALPCSPPFSFLSLYLSSLSIIVSSIHISSHDVFFYKRHTFLSILIIVHTLSTVIQSATVPFFLFLYLSHFSFLIYLSFLFWISVHQFYHSNPLFTSPLDHLVSSRNLLALARSTRSKNCFQCLEA